MLVADILKRKGDGVIAVGAHTPLATAIGIMNGAAIGALALPVGQAMIADPPVIAAHDDLRGAMMLMTERRARHLPVLSAGRAIGLLSLGDIVKWRLTEKALENAVLLDMARWRHAA